MFFSPFKLHARNGLLRSWLFTQTVCFFSLNASFASLAVLPSLLTQPFFSAFRFCAHAAYREPCVLPFHARAVKVFFFGRSGQFHALYVSRALRSSSSKNLQRFFFRLSNFAFSVFWACAVLSTLQLANRFSSGRLFTTGVRRALACSLCLGTNGFISLDFLL